ncbi:MAG: DUF1993 domain-containing protein [Proteobacteria bacterium]|nr:DUF1993 domain-containing protein [Pseudomonadota bacterium]
MTISMYAASVPVLRRMLVNLAGILKKAADHAEARKIDPGVLLNARLFPDMFPLLKQVQIVTDNAKGLARLAGIEIPKYEDNETSFAELQARITKTIAFLDTLKQDQVDGSEARDIILQVRGKTLELKGQDFLLNRWCTFGPARRQATSA